MPHSAPKELFFARLEAFIASAPTPNELFCARLEAFIGAAMVPVHPQPIFPLAFRLAVVQSANCAPFHLRHGNMTTATDFHSPGSVGIAVHCRIYILHACKRLAVSRAILSIACDD